VTSAYLERGSSDLNRLMKMAMKTMRAVFLAACVAQAVADWQASSETVAANPLSKVLQMLSGMEKSVIKEGESVHHAYTEFSGMCENRAQELQHEIKIINAEVEDLKAAINKATDDDTEADSQIEELSSTTSTCESDLKASTKIREKEAGDFAENQKDLIDTISQMERAMSILEKHMNKGASFAQMPLSMSRSVVEMQKQREAELTEAFAAIVDASFISSADASSLSSLIQTSDDAKDGDEQLDAEESSYGNDAQEKPSGASTITDTLDGLLEKAQVALQKARDKETTSSHNFLMFKGSLERKLVVATKEMADTKKDKAEAGQKRAEAQGELSVSLKDIKEDRKALEQLHHECMTRAADYEDETKSRGDELKALATAKKVLKEMTGDAGKQTYDEEFAQVSFMQTRSRSKSGSLPPTMQAAHMMRLLGQRQHLPSLVQLAHKVEVAFRSSETSGTDPFKKVKGMISSMLGSLVKQMEEEASHKVYCDKEMADTSKGKSAKEANKEKLETKIDMQTSRSMNLKRQVAELQKEVGSNLATQKEMDQMRKQESAAFKIAKPDIEKGLEGVKKALQVLREYYSQDDDKAAMIQGAAAGGGGVIAMLEVVESDFSKGLASIVTAEDTAQAAYNAQTHENSIARAIKEKDVVFKTKEAKTLDKSTSESSTDLDGVQTELDALNQYWSKIQQECVAKAEPYEERRKRQQKTLQGLQDAGEILEGRALLLQGSGRMRGSHLREVL